jgi:FolB domain-containing protein
MTTKNSLSINKLELNLFLGWPDDERLRKQIILLDIEIQLPNLVKACSTDHLDDTVCYRQLIESLRCHFSEKKFHLIEHVTAEAYALLKSLLPEQTTLQVSLTKRPQIDGLGSVTFLYGDDAT